MYVYIVHILYIYTHIIINTITIIYITYDINNN